MGDEGGAVRYNWFWGNVTQWVLRDVGRHTFSLECDAMEAKGVVRCTFRRKCDAMDAEGNGEIHFLKDKCNAMGAEGGGEITQFKRNVMQWVMRGEL